MSSSKERIADLEEEMRNHLMVIDHCKKRTAELEETRQTANRKYWKVYHELKTLKDEQRSKI